MITLQCAAGLLTLLLLRVQSEGASKEEQEQLLLAHEKDLQSIVNKMDADKLRMQSTLQEKLKKRRYFVFKIAIIPYFSLTRFVDVFAVFQS